MRELDDLIDQGLGISGHEANCAFQNLGDGTFATVSALSGFDFADDTRALALTDWDGDGDVDVWTTNRTAPAVRYLRNDRATDHGWIQLQLTGGPGSPRDATGAVVTITLTKPGAAILRQTLKAGEGYLSQSSRRLHFGLGNAAGPLQVEVRWPSGKKETFPGLQPRAAWHLREGKPPQALPLPPAKKSPAGSAPLPAEPVTLSGPALLYDPLPLPALPVLDTSGKSISLTDAGTDSSKPGGPLLVNVFARWCAPCLEELPVWRDAAPRFREADLRIALLTADGMDARHQETPEQAFAWLRANKIPFPAWQLTAEASRRLSEAHRMTFGARVALPVPVSFLLDGQGRLAAVYAGKVTPERLLEDVRALADPAAFRRAALPWPGRWLQPPSPPNPSHFLEDLVRRDFLPDAANYFRRHLAGLRQHRNFPAIAGALAGRLRSAGDLPAALHAGEAALAAAPENVELLNNQADLLATAPPPLRQPAQALALAQKAVTLTARRIPALLDTLSTAQAATGDKTAAIVTAREALQLATAAGDQAMIQTLTASLRRLGAP